MGATVTSGERRVRGPAARTLHEGRVSGQRRDSLTRTEWCLRIGAAGCFIGHGAFGILTKAAWVPFFGVVGLGPDAAYALMPIVGAVDIAAGILVVVSPRPIVLLYMVVWATWTALLRPLTGDSPFEMLERAGNYGVPLALLLMLGVPRTPRALLHPYRTRPPVIDRIAIGRVLLWTTATLLFSHGALAAVTGKPILATHYAAVGLPASIAPIVGFAEMAVAALVVVAPVPALLVAISVWKMLTEALFPISGTPIWEFIERAGSYTAPIALVLLFAARPFSRINLTRSSTP